MAIVLLAANAQGLLSVLATNPFQNRPPDEIRPDDLSGAHSRRINAEHRLLDDLIDAERQ